MKSLSVKNESGFVRFLKKIFPYFTIASGILLLLFQSTFAPRAGKAPLLDSSVYMYTGWMMKQGFLPYLNVWDNKGPVFYLMEMLGISGGTLTLWLFEGLLLFIAFVFCYKMFKLYVNKNIAIVSTLFLLLSMVFVFDRGNLVEEFALPFCFIALYILAKYPLQKNSLKFHQILILGGTFGAVLLMRPNIPMMWLAFCFVLLVHAVIIKKYIRLLTYPLIFLLGMFIVMLPFIIYLSVNGALEAYINCTMFIKTDFVPVTTQMMFFSGWEDFFFLNEKGTIGATLLIVFMAVTPIMLLLKKIKSTSGKLIIAFVFVGFVLTYAANAAVGYAFPHYAMMFIPIMAFPVMYAFRYASNFFDNTFPVQKSRVPQIAVLLGICLLLALPALKESLDRIHTNYFVKEDSEFYSYVAENTSEDDMVFIEDGIPYYYYYYAQRPSPTKYIYMLSLFTEDFYKEVENERLSDIINKQPEVIFSDLPINEAYRDEAGNYPLPIQEDYVNFVENNYTFVKQIDGYYLYQLNE